MFSIFFIAVYIVSVFGDIRNFIPKEPLDLPSNHNRIWFHLNPKCFPSELEVRKFKDYLLSKYSCIAFNEEREIIYKHPVNANYSVWSLWIEKAINHNLKCLNTSITLPQNVISSCIDNVYYEPLESIDDDYKCSDQATSLQIDLWSLDWLDGIRNDLYLHPVWDDDDAILQKTKNVEAIILDTDVDANHVEFVGLDPENLFIGTPAPTTSQNHGTHVAGTVVGNLVGGSKNTKLRWYPVCQLGSSCAWSDIEDGYNTAIAYMERENGPIRNKRFVINYSVGGSRSSINEPAYTKWGEEITDAGGIWVTSAGNNNGNACDYAPSFSEWAITVGAYDVYTQASSFSNYGSCTDAWGPGSFVWSATPGDGYGSSSGTSMSSPNIAALLANLLKLDESMTLAQIKQYLIDNARNVNGGIKGNMNQAFLQCV